MADVDGGTIGTGEGCATTFREGRETAVECARRRGGATRPRILVQKFPSERGRVTPYRLVYAATLARVHTALTTTALPQPTACDENRRLTSAGRDALADLIISQQPTPKTHFWPRQESINQRRSADGVNVYIIILRNIILTLSDEELQREEKIFFNDLCNESTYLVYIIMQRRAAGVLLLADDINKLCTKSNKTCIKCAGNECRLPDTRQTE